MFDNGKARLKKEVKRLFIFMLAISVFLFPISLEAHAFTRDDLCWNGYVLTQKINYIPHRDFGSLSIAHMNDALYVWNEAMNNWLLSRSPTERHTSKSFPLEDNKSKVYRVTNSNTDIVAENHIYSLGGSVTESDININMACDWANSAQSGKYDVWSVFLHEAGHTVGLGDRDDTTQSVMYWLAFQNTERRALYSIDQYNIDERY